MNSVVVAIGLRERSLISSVLGAPLILIAAAAGIINSRAVIAGSSLRSLSPQSQFAPVTLHQPICRRLKFRSRLRSSLVCSSPSAGENRPNSRAKDRVVTSSVIPKRTRPTRRARRVSDDGAPPSVTVQLTRDSDVDGTATDPAMPKSGVMQVKVARSKRLP
jgi:hypothetical protein